MGYKDPNEAEIAWTEPAPLEWPTFPVPAPEVEPVAVPELEPELVPLD